MEFHAPDSKFHDCYFFDPELAYRTAMMKNRVQLTHAVDGTQVCYLATDLPIRNAPENLVQVPINETVDFLTNTWFRYPTRIVPPREVRDPKVLHDLECNFLEVIETAKLNRNKIMYDYAKKILRHKPEFISGEPLRVFCSANRLTTVMQYATRDLANAFRRLGHEVHFMIEENDMQYMPVSAVLKAHYEFNPHLVLNINHQNNAFLPPETVNVTWWQDLMPAIKDRKPLNWRERDLIFSYTGQFDSALRDTGATCIQRQQFCIDTSIFRPDPSIERENKVVFIGSGAHPDYHRELQTQGLEEALTELFSTGCDITEEMVNQLAIEHDSDPELAWYRLYYLVGRIQTVRWLCQQKDVKVEVYGRWWENDPIIRPHFKGEVPHGEEIARIYNSAKYALVVHPFVIQSQRLSEAGACGCIPLVYDCRHIAEQPHWDDHCLFFKSKDQLFAALKQEITPKPEDFIAEYSFDSFAEKIIEQIQELTGWTPPGEAQAPADETVLSQPAAHA